MTRNEVQRVFNLMNKIEFQKGVSETTEMNFVSVDDVRKEIKRLEQEVEHKLTTYSNLSERIQQEIQEGSDNELAFSNSELSDELKFLLNKVQIDRALFLTNFLVVRIKQT